MKIWKKIVLGLGTGAIVVAGARHYWKLKPPEYKDNITTIQAPFENVAVVGDTGEDSEQRQWLQQSLERRPVKILLMGGDNCYDVGCADKPAFIKHFVDPFTRVLKELIAIIAVQGNHDDASLHEEERDFIINLLKDGPVEKVHMKYYYTGYVFKDASGQTDYCLGTADNTMYLAKFGDPPAQKLQDQYLDKFFHEKTCLDARRGLLWHIPVLSAGDHGDTKFKDQIAIYHDKFRGWIHDIFSGHDHNLSFDGCYENTCHWLSGAGSKLRPLKSKPRVWAASVPGYLWITRPAPKTFLYQFIEAKNGSDTVIFEKKVVHP